MLTTLLFSFGVFTLLYIGFVMQRYGLSLLREELAAEERAAAVARGRGRRGGDRGDDA